MPTPTMSRAGRAALLVLAALALPGASPRSAEPGAASAVRLAAVDIDLDLRPDLATMEEDVRIRLEGHGVAEAELRLHPEMVVERVDGAGGILVDHRRDGDRVRLSFQPPLDGAAVVRLRITGHPRRGGDARIDGSVVALDPDLDWYPRSDGAYHDATLRIRIPDGWTVASAGESGREPDGRWRFSPDGPVRSLGVAAARDLRVAVTEAAGTSVRVIAADADDAAIGMAGLVGDPLAWFAASLRPYPFDGLTVALVPGLPERIEASGFVAVPAADPPRTRADAASLLARQWFGEALDGDGAWILSFAAWHASAYARDRGLAPAADLARAREAYLRLDARRDVALADAGRDAPDAVVRGKGAAAAEMVRSIVGPRRFLAVLSGLAVLAPGRATFGDLRALVRAEAGAEGVRTLDDWFGKAGLPRLRVTLRVMEAAGGGHRADVRVEQLSGDYALPLDVVLVGDGHERRETLTLSEAVTDVYYLLDFRPVRIDVDPLARLFARPPEIVLP